MHISGKRSRSFRRRNLLIVGASLAIATMVGGCTASTPADDGDIELTVLNQSRGQEAALTALAAQYSEDNGITITIDTPGPADYIAKLQSLAQSKAMPDLFSAIGATDMAPFYRAGLAVNLQPELEGDWGDNFLPSLIDITTFADGNSLGIPAGIYGAHYDIASYGLYANPANVNFDPSDPPATMEDLIDELATGGVGGKGQFSVAASLTPQLVQYFASNYMTDAEIEATFNGEASWETPEWKKTFELFGDLASAGAIASNSLPGGTDDNTSVEQSFFNTQDVGVIFDSTAAVSVAKATAADFTDYQSFGLPAASNADFAPRPAAASGKGFAISSSSSSEHQEAALAFLKWLTEPEQQKYFADNAGLVPTNPDLLASGGLAEQLTGLGSALAEFQAVSSSMTTDVRDVIVRASQSLVLGEGDIDQVLADVQKAQDLSK